MNWLIFLAAYLLIVGAIGLLTYILNSIGLMTIARHRDIQLAGLAWVPFIGQAYIRVLWRMPMTNAIKGRMVNSGTGFWA
jgi:hypothetical protein